MASVDPKIIDLLKEEQHGKIPVSLEYFPPRTEDGVKVCWERYIYFLSLILITDVIT